MRHRIRVRDLESAFLQVVAVIQKGAADEEGAFRIDHDADVRGLNHDVAIGGPIDEIHFVLQAGAPPADDRHAQCARGAPLFLQERIQLFRGVLGDFDETLVTNLVIDGGGWS